MSATDSEVLGQLLREWSAWQITRNCQRTVVERRRALLRFASTVDPVTATSDDVIRWIGDQAWQPATRQSQFAYVRHFYRWLQRTGKREDDPTATIDPPKVPRAMPRPASAAAIGDLMERGHLRTRTRMMVLLATYQGLRVHEIAKIKGRDMDNGTLYVEGKGGVRASLPLHPRIAEYAAVYPALFGRGWWFPSSRGGHILYSSVSETLATAFRRTGHDYTAHQLRHWYGTNVHRASGGDILVTQQLMRHASPQTTAIYAQVDDTDRRAAVDRLPRIA